MGDKEGKNNKNSDNGDNSDNRDDHTWLVSECDPHDVLVTVA